MNWHIVGTKRAHNGVVVQLQQHGVPAEQPPLEMPLKLFIQRSDGPGLLLQHIAQLAAALNE